MKQLSTTNLKDAVTFNQCSHCQHQAVAQHPDYGTAELCDFCGLSIFLSPEEVITEHITITQQMIDDMNAWYEEYMEDMKAEHALNALENQSYEQ